MSDTAPILHRVTDGGVAAEHLPLPAPPALVAPAHSPKEHNTIKSSLIPFACWRANDMRFDFESSFVLPEIATEIGVLNDLVDRHTLIDEKTKAVHKPALTVFGHADPTGGDDFNKSLSGRRAQAIYGMLVRKVDLWEDLYSNPLGNDKWEPNAIHRMQSTLGQPLSEHPSPAARKALFKAYMEHICTVRDEDDQPVLDDAGNPARLELAPGDFLADGADASGKGDYQGCGEFNPIRMFSKAENEEFSHPDNKEERDSENAPNRRVLIFLFRPGVRIKPGDWPCPRAKEGVEGCKKRFWSDAAKRRQFQENRREYKDTLDTFACRFYDRLSNNSPCETVDPSSFSHISVLLRSNSGAVALANLRYRIKINEVWILQGRTDQNGLVHHENIPPGDYELELNGRTADCLVPTMPKHLERRTLRVNDFFLFEDAPPSTLVEVDPNEDLQAQGGESISSV